MNEPIWPENLPYPNLSGYGVSHSLPLIRTEMESGPSRTTRLAKSYISEISCAFTVSREQQELFEEFFEHDCNAGANWVLMPVDTVAGVAYHRVRITSRSSSPFGFDYKTITLVIETEDRIKGLGY